VTISPKGIKIQVFGAMLVCLGAMTALLAGAIGFELDIFYVAISIAGAVLFVYGALKKKQYKNMPLNHSQDTVVPPFEKRGAGGI
jgi:threonine/homoserine/homoserine lactone efflux protein